MGDSARTMAEPAMSNVESTPPNPANYHPQTPIFHAEETEKWAGEELVELEPLGESQPPDIDPYLRGKLTVALAVGLAPCEAAAWFRTSEAEIGRLLAADREFAAELKRYAALAALYPILRISQAANTSWRAALWLDKYFARLEGEVSGEELRGGFTLFAQQFRYTLFAGDRAAESQPVTSPEEGIAS